MLASSNSPSSVVAAATTVGAVGGPQTRNRNVCGGRFLLGYLPHNNNEWISIKFTQKYIC